MSQGTFWQELWLCQPATLTLIFSSHVLDFSSASAVASGIHLTVKVCLCLCLCLSVSVSEGLWLSVPLILASCHSSIHRCQQVGRLPIASVAHLTIWGEAGGAKMSEISTGVSSSNHACQAISVYINLWNNVQPSQLAHGGHFVAFGLLTGLAHFEVDLSHEFTLQWVNSRVVDAWSVKTQWPEAKFLYRASL